MSNLYKPYAVKPGEHDTRVINSNDKVEQRLLELQRSMGLAPQAAKTAGGFVEGIAAPFVEVEPEPEIDYVAIARGEAETIVMQAKLEAESILQDAAKQAEELRQQAQAEGNQTGYQEGAQRADEELNQRLKELDIKEKEMDSCYQRQMNELEPQLLDVILQVVEKVFHIQFDDKKDILLYLITKTIRGVEGCKQFQIRVGHDNYQFLQNQKEDIMSRIGADMSIEIVADGAVSDNQCMIETDVGVFECGLGVQLENLIKDLRSLCS